MLTRSDKNSKALLPMVAAGDSQAVHDFVDKYGPVVWAMLRRSLSEPHAHDVSREVFKRLFAEAASLSSDPIPEIVSVASVVHSVLANVHERDPIEFDFTASNKTVHSTVNGVPELVAVSRSLITLPHERKRVVELCVLKGLTAAQISDKMNLDLNAVRRHMRRGLQQARSSFGAVPSEERRKQGEKS